MTIDITTPRNCTRCDGTGTKTWSFDKTTESCRCCGGTGKFEGFSVEEVINLITTKPTKKNAKRRFRASFPSELKKWDNRLHARAYFVWRLARFHGGKDVTMPMNADLAIHGDPFKKELDQLASEIAKLAFGTDMAGAARWASALSGVSIPADLPSSAYPGGPVADENKPDWELIELT